MSKSIAKQYVENLDQLAQRVATPGFQDRYILGFVESLLEALSRENPKVLETLQGALDHFDTQQRRRAYLASL